MAELKKASNQEALEKLTEKNILIKISKNIYYINKKENINEKAE